MNQNEAPALIVFHRFEPGDGLVSLLERAQVPATSTDDLDELRAALEGVRGPAWVLVGAVVSCEELEALSAIAASRAAEGPARGLRVLSGQDAAGLTARLFSELRTLGLVASRRANQRLLLPPAEGYVQGTPRLLNVSASGVGLWTPTPLTDACSTFVLTLRWEGDPTPHRTLCQLARTERLHNGHLAGLHFLQLAPALRRRLGQTVQAASPSSLAPPLQLSGLSPYEPGTGQAVAVLLNVELGAALSDFLRRGGVTVLQARSVSQAMRLLAEAPGRRALLFDITEGGNASERLAAGWQTLGGDSPETFPMLLATRPPGSTGGARSRCWELGLDAVYTLPSGAVTELVRRFFEGTNDSIARVAARANLRAPLQETGPAGIQGELLNLSESGALIRTSRVLTKDETVQIGLRIPGGTAAEVSARVVWVEPEAAGYRAGLALSQPSRALTAKIRAFVRDYNVLVSAPAPNKATGSTAPLVRTTLQGTKRTDYFRLLWQSSDEALLLPKRDFFVPFRVGDALTLQQLKPAMSELLSARICATEALEPGRIDGRLAWRIRVEESPAPTAGRPPAG